MIQDPNLSFLRKSQRILLGISVLIPALFLYYKFTHPIVIAQKEAVETLAHKATQKTVLELDTLKINKILPLSGTSRDIVLNTQGDLAYVAAYGQGVHILSLKSPLNPVVLSSFRHNAKYDDTIKVLLSPDEKILYVLGATGLYNLNIQDPRHPQLISFLALKGGHNLTLSKDNRRIYVSGAFGVGIVRIKKDKSLAIQGRLHYLLDRKQYIVDKFSNIQYAMFEQVADVIEVDDNILYIISRHPDVIDITDLSSVKTIAHFSTLGYAQQVTVSENRQRIYISSGDSGIEIFDISDYLHPKPLGGHNTEGSARHSTLSKHGNVLFVSSLNRGLEIFDITYPYDPKLLKRVEKKSDTLKGQAHGSASSADGKVLYIAYGVIGLGIITLEKTK